VIFDASAAGPRRRLIGEVHGNRWRRVRRAALETDNKNNNNGGWEQTGRLTSSSTSKREECGTTTTLAVCCVWRRESFSSAMLQRILQRSTAAGRPQLRRLTEPGEACTTRSAVRPILLTTACPMMLYTVSAQ
jgi:hypothetical protein